MSPQEPPPGPEATRLQSLVSRLTAERDAARLEALEAAFDQQMVWLRWLGEVAPELLAHPDLPTILQRGPGPRATPAPPLSGDDP